MIRVGIIGMGFMGGVHLNAWRAVERARVVAVCDEKPVSADSKKGNIDTGADVLDLEGVAIHTRVAEMLEQEALDAVSITLPTHLHKAISIQCLEAGAHVLCEKPMALNPADCQAMIDAADAAGRRLMVAQCIRFWPEYAWLKQAIAQATYGKALAADFQRLTFKPAWSADSWFADQSKSGGIALDLHIHDIDFIRYAFGEPHAIQPHAIPHPDGGNGHILTRLDYGGTPEVSATASWLMPQSYGFSMSYKVVFERAAAVFANGKLLVYTDEDEPFSPELPAGDGYAREINHFAALLREEVHAPIIPPADAAESVRLTLEVHHP